MIPWCNVGWLSLTASSSRPCVDDLPRDLGLTSHRVDGDQTARKFQHFQQFRDGRDLVALRVDDHLAQADVIGCGPGTDHVNGRLAAGRVEAAAERLAVDGHHLPSVTSCRAVIQLSRHFSNSAGLMAPRIALKRSCDGMPALRSRNCRQPLPLLAAELRNRHEIIRTADHGADGDASPH